LQQPTEIIRSAAIVGKTMNAVSLEILSETGQVTTSFLDAALVSVLKPLAYGHAQYFVFGPRTRRIPLGTLILSRARSEGIRNANALMHAAAAGNQPRRAPIKIVPLKNGKWQVTDGNSTAVNAMLSSWPDIPCDLETR
jgi:hypothetical protein